VSLKPTYSKEEVLELAAVFEQFETAVPAAWARLVSLVRGMQEQVIKVGLSNYEHQLKVAFNAGYHDGLGEILKLPTVFIEAARKYKTEEETEKKTEAERIEALIRRATEGGEVAV
jgi:hypothetical protein